MAKSLDDLRLALTELETTVDEVKVKVDEAIKPVDVEPEVNRIVALKDKVNNFVPAPVEPPAAPVV